MSARYFTFGITYPNGYVEEIDVTWCRTYAEARSAAERLAREEYEPGWTGLIDLAAGGSGGLVGTWS